MAPRWLLLLLAAPRLAAAAHPGALQRYPPEKWSVQAYVDNFEISGNATFTQRAFSYDRWWRKDGPILLYLGNEGPLEDFYNYTGAIFEHAEALGALVAFVEHRYYGKSIPSKDFRGLTVEQAMADYAWFVPELRKRFGCPSDGNGCPIVTFGGSYGGMLVAWFRQKYPQLTVGGIAAGAPVDFYPRDGRQAAFWKAVMHTFSRFGTEGCAESFSTALATLQEKLASAAAREALQKPLASCDALGPEETAGAKVDLFLRGVLASLAMLDYTEASTFVVKLPANPVREACKLLQGASDDAAGLRAVADLYLNGTGSMRCYDYVAEMVGRPTIGELKGPRSPPDMGAWQYQACNELLLETLASDGYGFYPAADEQLEEVAAACQMRYGVTPRPGWLQLSLGGSDLRVGQLLFTDGEKDPWHSGAAKPEKIRPGLGYLSSLRSPKMAKTCPGYHAAPHPGRCAP